MKVEFARLLQIIPFFINTFVKNSDYTKLTRYIISLNQQNSVQEIINTMSQCIKDILNYRVFAFAIKQDIGIDVWLDPRMYRKSLESVFIKDFHLSEEADINYLNHAFEHEEKEQEFNLENLISYRIGEINCQGRIYILPSRNMASYHDDIVSMVLKSTAVALSKQINIDKLTNAASLDPLTGCYNRREFDAQILKSISNAKRYGNHLSIFMFDIDHFKKVNDTYGHQAGDAVLQEVSNIVKNNIRKGDIIARYGGEEFIVMLPSAKKRESIELAERLREKIEHHAVITDAGTIKVTASFGVSSVAPVYEISDSVYINKLIEDADSMMYKAKLNGRNSVMPGLLQICRVNSKPTGTI